MKIDPPGLKFWLIIVVEDPKGGPWSHFSALSGQAPDRNERSKVTICMPLFERHYLDNPRSQTREICAILFGTEQAKWWTQKCGHPPSSRDAVEPLLNIFVFRVSFFPRSFLVGTSHREKHTTVFGDRPRSTSCQRARRFTQPFSQEVPRYALKSSHFAIVPYVCGHFSKTRANFKNSSDGIVEKPLRKLQVKFQANPFTLLRSFRILLNPNLTFSSIAAIWSHFSPLLRGKREEIIIVIYSGKYWESNHVKIIALFPWIRKWEIK